MEKKLITVFTPTYNRIKLLPQCYESLKRQTCRDFLWLIVDDGSSDGTGALAAKWMAEEKDFAIQYISKPNGGLHTAYNAAIEAAETELMVCVDSDDYLTDTAIERIARCWNSRGDASAAGIVALNENQDAQILGRRLPELEREHLITLYCQYSCRSDLKMIYRTDLLKREGPIPVFEHEKYMNPYYLFLKIDQKLPMLLLNEPVCVVNYQADGMSAGIVYQYVQSPRSFAALRRMMVSMEGASAPYVFKNSVHLVSSALLAKDLSLLKGLPRKGVLSLAFLPGVLLCAAIKLLVRKGIGREKAWK